VEGEREFETGKKSRRKKKKKSIMPEARTLSESKERKIFSEGKENLLGRSARRIGKKGKKRNRLRST